MIPLSYMALIYINFVEGELKARAICTA